MLTVPFTFATHFLAALGGGLVMMASCYRLVWKVVRAAAAFRAERDDALAEVHRLHQVILSARALYATCGGGHYRSSSLPLAPAMDAALAEAVAVVARTPSPTEARLT